MTERPKHIRLAGPQDEDKIMELMRAAFVEQPIFPLDEAKMREMIRGCSTRKGGFIALAENSEGKIEGYLIAVLSQYWYSSQWHMEELSNFVHPDARKGTHHARDLIEFAKWFAETMKVPLLMGIFSTQRLEAKIRLYQRQAKMAGAVFVHNTGHVDGLLSEMG
jgi:hypothetical protein